MAKLFKYSISNEHGFNGPGITEKDYWFGGNTKLDPGKVRRKDRNWLNDTPTEEPQSMKFYDDYGCLTHSGQSGFETDLIAQQHDGNAMVGKVLTELDLKDEQQKPNFSDDYNVLLSGTIPYVGNSQGNVSESFRRDGLISQKKLSFGFEMTKEQYNNMKRITPDMKLSGKKTLEFFKIGWERIPYVSGMPFANPDDLYEALGYFPMQVIVAAERVVKNGLLMPLESYTYNHAQLLVRGTYKKSFRILDSYQNSRGDVASFYKDYDWNYRFGWPLRYSIELIRGIEDVEAFLREFEGQFVQGSTPAIYLIQNGKKRPFAYWVDYVLYEGGKGVAKRVSDTLLSLVPDGSVMNPRESANWKYVQDKYELLLQLSKPDNILRVQQLISQGKAAEGEVSTSATTLPANVLPPKPTFWSSVGTFLKKLFK